jgi:hypothetical protein
MNQDDSSPHFGICKKAKKTILDHQPLTTPQHDLDTIRFYAQQ